ncbi:MAG: MBL fold metallo-hydrolase, partial [Nitriliruptorales bacterium]|nr:MBL fold metallo-hydrolase [Nitriliruptorales bacterium]
MGEVVTFETPSLGDRSYLVHDGKHAVVIDPQRDIDRFLTAAEDAGVEITHVLETHVHNDYVSGGLELSRTTAAKYGLAAGEDVEFDRFPIQDGDDIVSGDVRLRAVHTPGHTPTHLSYVLVDDGDAVAGFTGGSLLYGAVGRPDLISEDLTLQLAHAQYRSVHSLADQLRDDAAIHPTHGFGSHCASVTDEILRDGTVADERERNPALTKSEDTFVEELLEGLHPYPAYYAHMGPANASGPAPLDLSTPGQLDAAALREHLDAGHWLVDLRTRRAYASGHLRGTVNVELRNDLPTYLGWIFPYGTSFVLLGDTLEDISEAQRMLTRIGLDDPAGSATGGPDDWAEEPSQLRSWDAASWSDLATARQERDDVVVLDTREHWEFDSGAHPAAVHIPFYELDQRMGELPDGEVWVYCATGNRATVAASMLA